MGLSRICFGSVSKPQVKKLIALDKGSRVL
jgi:hypothetical protein